MQLELSKITKSFSGVLANDRVDFNVRAGEVHALLGENGAGKTTLMSILSGLYKPDSGDILIDGTLSNIRSPQGAIDLGIGMVHQRFMLIRPFTVAENMILGLKSSRGLFLEDSTEVSARVTELSNHYALKVNPTSRIQQISLGEQQRVEILKALYRKACLLILDEPTAVLTPQEATDLFVTIKALVREGKSVVFISHKLNEVMAISNRITVMRQGKVVGTVETTHTNESELARLMIGKESIGSITKATGKPGPVLLEARELTVIGEKSLVSVHGVCISLRAGEILGIAGVDGNGQTELAEALMGLRKIAAGNILVEGIDLTGAPPSRIANAGVAYVPGDRDNDGIFGDMNLAENLSARSYDKPPFASGPFLNKKAILSSAHELITRFDIRCTGRNMKAGKLSGGNAQKLIIARELSRKPRILIVVQPSHGLDIAATSFVHQQLSMQRDSGVAVLVISTELEEILAICDRIAVMFNGHLTDLGSPQGITREKIGLLMAGAPISDADKPPVARNDPSETRAM